jgi:hypothetical protein
VRRAAALVALLVALALAPAAGAQTADEEGAARLRFTSITPWVPGAGSFDVHLSGDLTGRSIGVAVHGRLSSRSQFVQTLEGKLLGRPLKQLTIPTSELSIDAVGSRILSLPLPRLDTPPTPATLPGLREGVYPVVLTLREDGEVVDRAITHLVRVPDGPVDLPLAVALVVPLRVPPRDDGTVRPADHQALAATAQIVGEAVDVPLTLDPSAFALATLTPTEAAPLRTVVADGDQLLAGTWVPVDPGALVDADRPGDLSAQRQAGEDGVLAVFGDRGDPRTWSVDGTLTPAAATRLRELGVSRVVVPEPSLEPLAPAATRGLTLTRPFRLAGTGGEAPLDAAAAEPGLAAHFTDEGDQVLAANHLLADLAVLFLDSPGSSRGVAVRPPADWRPDPTFLRAVVPALGRTSTLRPVTVDELLDDVPLLGTPRVTIRRLASDVRPTAVARATLARAATAVDELAALVGPTAEPVVAARRRLLTGEAVGLPTGVRTALLAGVGGTLDEVRGRIRIPDDRTFRLTAREGTIPLTIRNDNPFPVFVDLELSSEKLEFEEAEGTDRSRYVVRDLVLEPGALTRTIPVRARASAAFSLRARLLTPGGAELVRSRYTVISTVFSGVGIALSVAAGGFLLLWWGSHWRTVRRGRRLVDPPKDVRG